MNLSMWNIYHSLQTHMAKPLIKEGKPTIQYARWIVNSNLSPDAVYVGNGSDYIGKDDENTAIIVHRNDLIVVNDADIGELFNEICSIIDRFNAWEHMLMEYVHQEDGLQKMIDDSDYIIQQPAFIYAPEGNAIAVSTKYSADIHWHWKEILDNHGLTEKRLKLLKQSIKLTDVFQDSFPVVRDSQMGDHKYMHCNISANGHIIGHFVIFSFLKPFDEGLEYLVDNMLKYMEQNAEIYFGKYNPVSRFTSILNCLLLNEEYNKKELDIWLKRVRWNADDTYQIMAFEENVENVPVLLNTMYAKFLKMAISGVVFIIGTCIVIIENQSCIEFRKSILLRIKELTGEEFRCGVSSNFRNICDCRLYYQQALLELRRCNIDKCAVSYADENSLKAIRAQLLKESWVKTYVNKNLLYLKNYDIAMGTAYYKTLKIYFYTGFHASDAASLLHLHRNSLAYRLDKIRELIDFTEFDRMILERKEEDLTTIFLSFVIIDSDSTE